MTEIMIWGFTNLDNKELERYVNEDFSVLRDFILTAHLNTTFAGFFSRNEIVPLLRLNWPFVEALLLKWTELRKAIQETGKGKILSTPKGERWFYKQTRQFYVYLLALCYTFYCPKCRKLIKNAHDPLIAKWNNERTKILSLYHFECVVSRQEFLRVANNVIKVNASPSPMVDTVRVN